jgi:hypothetical protein
LGFVLAVFSFLPVFEAGFFLAAGFEADGFGFPGVFFFDFLARLVSFLAEEADFGFV